MGNVMLHKDPNYLTPEAGCCGIANVSVLTPSWNYGPQCVANGVAPSRV